MTLRLLIADRAVLYNVLDSNSPGITGLQWR